MRFSAGLSLLELLVALALMATIAAGLSQSMGTGIRVWEASNEIHADEERLILRSRLRTWIEHAEPARRLLPFDNRFVGTESGFTFLTLANTPHEPDAAALRVRVFSEEEILSMTLDYLDDAGNVYHTDTRTLAVGVVKFAYYEDAQDGRDWHNNWKTDKSLPALVRIDLDAIEWPEFTVAPLLR